MKIDLNTEIKCKVRIGGMLAMLTVHYFLPVMFWLLLNPIYNLVGLWGVIFFLGIYLASYILLNGLLVGFIDIYVSEHHLQDKNKIPVFLYPTLLFFIHGTLYCFARLRGKSVRRYSFVSFFMWIGFLGSLYLADYWREFAYLPVLALFFYLADYVCLFLAIKYAAGEKIPSAFRWTVGSMIALPLAIWLAQFCATFAVDCRVRERMEKFTDTFGRGLSLEKMDYPLGIDKEFRHYSQDVEPVACYYRNLTDRECRLAREWLDSQREYIASIDTLMQNETLNENRKYLFHIWSKVNALRGNLACHDKNCDGAVRALKNCSRIRDYAAARCSENDQFSVGGLESIRLNLLRNLLSAGILTNEDLGEQIEEIKMDLPKWSNRAKETIYYYTSEYIHRNERLISPLLVPCMMLPRRYDDDFTERMPKAGRRRAAEIFSLRILYAPFYSQLLNMRAEVLDIAVRNCREMVFFDRQGNLAWREIEPIPRLYPYKSSSYLYKILAPDDWGPAVQRRMFLAAANQLLARSAMEVELYRRRTGHVPESVALIKDWPPDPFDGKPLGYRYGVLKVKVYDARKIHYPDQAKIDELNKKEAEDFETCDPIWKKVHGGPAFYQFEFAGFFWEDKTYNPLYYYLPKWEEMEIKGFQVYSEGKAKADQNGRDWYQEDNRDSDITFTVYTENR